METTAFSFASPHDIRDILSDRKLCEPRHALTFNQSAFSHRITDSAMDDYRFLPLQDLCSRGLQSLITWFACKPSSTVYESGSGNIPRAVQLQAAPSYNANDLYSVRQLRFLADGQPNNVELDGANIYFKATAVHLYFCDGNNTEQIRTLHAMIEVHLNMATRRIECL